MNEGGKYGGFRGGAERGFQSRNVMMNRGEMTITTNLDSEGVGYQRGGGRWSGGYRDGGNYGGGGRRGRGSGFEGRGRGGKKKLPGNMVPRRVEPMPGQVKLVRELLIRVGDYTASQEEDEDLIGNMKNLAKVLMTLGDLEEFPAEIADVFLKCFSQLSAQVPIYASLLALIHYSATAPEGATTLTSGDNDGTEGDGMDTEGDAGADSTSSAPTKTNREIAQKFTALVVERLLSRIADAVKEDQILELKLLVRTVAALTAAGSFAVDGEGSCSEMLRELSALIESGSREVKSAEGAVVLLLTPAAQCAVYVLGSTMPWIAVILQNTADGQHLLSAVRSLLVRVRSQWVSPFGPCGLQTVLNSTSSGESTDTTVLSAGPCTVDAESDVLTYDTLWEASHMGVLAIDSAAEPLHADATGSGLSMPWLALQTEGLLPSPFQQGTECSLQLRFSTVNGGFKAALTQSRNTSDSNGTELCEPALGWHALTCSATNASSSTIGSFSTTSWLRPRFPIFEADSSEQCAACCAQLNVMQKMVCHSYCQDIIQFFAPIVNEDGTLLGSVELLAAHLLSLQKLFPVDARLEWLIVESVLQTILVQPVNTALSAQCFRMLLEMCKKQPAVFPKAIALGINICFQLLPELDACAAHEFARWFSFHLINTQLSWPYWDYWLSETTPSSTAFMRNVLRHCSAGVVSDKILSSVPTKVHDFLQTDISAHCALFGRNSAMEEHSSANSMLGHIPKIRMAAKKLLELLEQRIDSDDLTEWTEALNLNLLEDGDLKSHNTDASPYIEDQGEDVREWKGSLVLQGLLFMGGRAAQLSGTVGMLDKYSSTLHAIAFTDKHQQNLLDMLHEVYGHNSYMFNFCLDEMLRRQQVSTASASQWLCRPKIFGQLAKDDMFYRSIELVVDRSVDLVCAAVAQRNQLGEIMQPLDESADLSPSADHDGTHLAMDGMRSKRSGMIDEGEDASDEESDEERRGKRRKHAHTSDGDKAQFTDDGVAAAVQVDRMPTDDADAGDEDPLWAADEALKSAVRGSRSSYHCIIDSLTDQIVSILQQHQSANGPLRSSRMDSDEEAGEGANDIEEENIAWLNTAWSLLRRTLRTFHGSERCLTTEQQRKVLITAPSAQVTAFMQRLPLSWPQQQMWRTEMIEAAATAE